MWDDISQFTPTVLRNWLGIAGGGLIAVLGWWVWPYVCKKLAHPDWENAVPQPVITALVIAGFVWCFFSAWKSEHQEKIDAERSLAELSQPKLEGTIEWVGAGEWPNLPDGTPARPIQPLCFLAVSVINHGAPSAAVRWGVRVTLTDGRVIILQPYIPDFPFKVSEQTDFVKIEDFIQTKTMSPVAKGAIVTGYLLAVPLYDKEILKGELLRAKGTKYEVTFSDINRKQTIFEFTLTGAGAMPRMPVIPGLVRSQPNVPR